MGAPRKPVLAGVPGGLKAVLLFALSLSAFVAQSELAQYVQATRHYRKPLLLLYLSHSSFSLLLPLHVLLLRLTSTTPVGPTLRALERAVRQQVDDLPFGGRTAGRTDWPWGRGLVAIAGLTLGVTAPAGLWYLCVPLTSMTSITTLFNTSALFAYVFSVLLLGEAWAARKLVAVGLATAGVAVVAYGGAGGEGDQAGSFELLGDLLAIVGAAAYGLYEVCYKKFFSLDHARPSTPALSAAPSPQPKLPFALHPNLITSLLGLCTVVGLLPAFPALHFLGWETFETPWSFAASRSAEEGTPWGLTLAVAATGSLGVVFNGCFMICLSLWGPVVASVGNLLTIILIAVSDAIIHSSSSSASLSLTVIFGGSLVASSFAVLVWDMTRSTPESIDGEPTDEAEYAPLRAQDEDEGRGAGGEEEEEEAALVKGRSRSPGEVEGSRAHR